MSVDVQRVVVIQDAVRDVSPSVFRWVLERFKLKPGDMLILFGVLHQVINPMGYKIKVDSSSIFGINTKLIAEEVARKTEEYTNNPEIVKIAEQCEKEQIKFRIEVRAGSNPNVVALKAARGFEATWVILDRQMKKDKNYFIERLSCGISRMRRDNTLEKLRGPKAKSESAALPPGRTTRREDQISYGEMIPEISPKSLPPTKTSSSREQPVDRGEEQVPNRNNGKSIVKSSPSDQLGAAITSTSSKEHHEASSSTDARFSPPNLQEEGRTTNTERDAAGEQSPSEVAEGQPSSQQKESAPDEQPKQHENNDEMIGSIPTDGAFKNSFCSVCKNRRPTIGWQRDFSYAELHAATEGFAQKNFLSEGGFGSVYKGELNGLKIAVKQHKSASSQGEKEFKSEVNVLSKARHDNLVMLLGSCSEGSHRLLVYEFVCNGSLDLHLSKHTRRPLSWEKRMKIALGAARGLQYLHENSIIHRDMRPSNILITHDHEAMLGDFGLARTQEEDSDQSWETRVVGTLGYLAPEYAECGKVSTKTDVYCFGVVLLQLITGLKTTDKILGDKSLVGWARPLLKERNYPDLIDHRILDSHDVHQLFWIVRVAEKCLTKDPKKRLAMDKAVYALNYLMESFTSRSIKDISPAQSDSVSSLRDSSESQEDDTSFIVGTSSISSTSTTISQMSMRLLPSPPIRYPPLPSPPIRYPPSPPITAASFSGQSSSSTSYERYASVSGMHPGKG